MKKKLRGFGCVMALLSLGIVAAFVHWPHLRIWAFERASMGKNPESVKKTRDFLALVRVLPETSTLVPPPHPSPSVAPTPEVPFTPPSPEPTQAPEAMPSPEPSWTPESEDTTHAERTADAVVIRRGSDELARFTTLYKTDMPGGNGPAAVSGPHAWWGTKELLFHGDLVTKNVEVFLPYAGAKGEITALDADAGGVTITTSAQKSYRLNPERPDPKSGFAGYVRAKLGPETENPNGKQAVNLKQSLEGWLGVPYLWGGETKKGVDCSGLVAAAFKTVGFSLPRTSKEQATVGRAVNDSLVWGDLLCYDGHIAIYVGNGLVVEAQGAQNVAGSVKKTTIWHRACTGVRRLLK